MWKITLAINDLVDFNDLLLQFLHVLVSLGAPPVGGVESNLKFVDVLFQLLLGPDEVGLAASLGLEACLHRLQSALMILARTAHNIPDHVVPRTPCVWAYAEFLITGANPAPGRGVSTNS